MRLFFSLLLRNVFSLAELTGCLLAPTCAQWDIGGAFVGFHNDLLSSLVLTVWDESKEVAENAGNREEFEKGEGRLWLFFSPRTRDSLSSLALHLLSLFLFDRFLS